MGEAAEKLDAWTPESADPAVVVDLADYRHRRSRAACRLGLGSSHLAYELAPEPGFYRYTAFGQTKEDTATMLQPLRWKGRWHSTLNGAEIYDVRARQWAPEVGVFLSIDDYKFLDVKGTLWGWGSQNAVRFSDPSGHLPWGAPNPPPNFPDGKKNRKCSLTGTGDQIDDPEYRTCSCACDDGSTCSISRKGRECPKGEACDCTQN